MKLSEFDYELPPDRIAHTPLAQRDAARLLIDRGPQTPIDSSVDALPDLLRPGDLVVVNETKVLPARLNLRRITGGKAEVLLLEPTNPQRTRWEALVRPAKKLKPGEALFAASGVPIARIGERTTSGDTFWVELIGATDEIEPMLAEVGEMPLPPYITERLSDPDRYQTVYAQRPGSAAAPTAGLHFTPDLLDRIRARGVGLAQVELVVGLDTFRPIGTEDPLDHQIHTERYAVPTATMKACTDTRAGGGRVVAVGTTSVRALESAAIRGELEGRTNLFIHRGYQWKVVDMLLTNFHLPRTTLLMMIDAFVGDRWRDLYRHAMRSDGLTPPYRFLSFGDAMLLDRHAFADRSHVDT